MDEYTYRDWFGSQQTQKAARVTFEPSHVVFWDEEDRVILAKQNNSVIDLRMKVQ